ncbi:MAG: glycoside hydrolase 43 family protein [Spirochaetales bacterium]|nr:glycoside hydrolase 43 family protein [Spirochaetales bacterium]
MMIKNNTWGDLGNGYYRNPVLNADYSDPDVIRTGSDFYMICSDFHFMGMPVLHSRDLVNWSLISQVYRRLEFSPQYDRMEGYGKGSWAPALRYHNGLYYLYFCTPDEGLYMSTAKVPAGPWSSLHEVKRISGWEDPCPFWDDDGKAYLGHSIVGAGPIIIHRMSPDGTKLLDEGRIVYTGKIAEGTKIYKRNGLYYLIIPEGGVENGWQTAARSTSLYGPYERKTVLSQGKTAINGPHQGGMVELESGETWFLHFQSAGVLGRVCHLQPVQWIDDWPVMGLDEEPVTIFKKPGIPGSFPVCSPRISDDFESPELGPQWQWNHNPVDTNWTLTERPGYLRLKSLPARDIIHARNTLTQRLMGNTGHISIKLDTSFMTHGQTAGIAFTGIHQENWIGVIKSDENLRIKAITSNITWNGPVTGNKIIFFNTDIDINGSTRFSFSFDNVDFFTLGGNCTLESAFWKGARIGLFTYHHNGKGGCADFDLFYYNHDGPCEVNDEKKQ